MKLISTKNIFIILTIILITIGCAVLIDIAPYDLSFFRDSKVLFLNITLVIFTYILLKLIDITAHKRELDTNKNKTFIDFSKSVIVVISIMLIMQNMGYNFNALLAIGGAGGLIVGLAAKDLISNMFGYVTVLLDRPFNIGDLISSEQYKITGTVRRIGLRTTEIRRIDKKPMYVPNSLWTTASIINSSRKTNREIDIKVPLLCSDSEVLSKVKKELLSSISNISEIDKNHSVNAYLDNLDNYGAHLRIVLYLKNISVDEFYRIKEDILLQVLRIANNNNLEINMLRNA